MICINICWNLISLLFHTTGIIQPIKSCLCIIVAMWYPMWYRLRYGRMVKALACRVEGPRFESHHGKSSEKKKKKKLASYPLLAWWKSGWRECSPTRKKAGVCAIMSIWLVHIKEHVWTVGTCPTTILLSTVNMCECVWMAALKAVGKRGSVPLVDCGPVCSPGSWSGRGWLPLILAWLS